MRFERQTARHGCGSVVLSEPDTSGKRVSCRFYRATGWEERGEREREQERAR